MTPCWYSCHHCWSCIEHPHPHHLSEFVVPLFDFLANSISYVRSCSSRCLASCYSFRVLCGPLALVFAIFPAMRLHTLLCLLMLRDVRSFLFIFALLLSPVWKTFSLILFPVSLICSGLSHIFSLYFRCVRNHEDQCSACSAISSFIVFVVPAVSTTFLPSFTPCFLPSCSVVSSTFSFPLLMGRDMSLAVIQVCSATVFSVLLVYMLSAE